MSILWFLILSHLLKFKLNANIVRIKSKISFSLYISHIGVNKGTFGIDNVFAKKKKMDIINV
mgnify:CR=1 FL=1